MRVPHLAFSRGQDAGTYAKGEQSRARPEALQDLHLPMPEVGGVIPPAHWVANYGPARGGCREARVLAAWTPGALISTTLRALACIPLP